MKTSALRRVLESVLLTSVPVLLADCLAQSSCPDDGVEPPLAQSVAVEASFAGGGPLDGAQCTALCDSTQTGVITCVRDSPASVLCLTRPFPCEGRRPVGLRAPARRAVNGFEGYLGDAAWLEGASVDAFRILRHELRAHGAPRRLLRGASRGMRDERRHARVTRALAGRFGAPLLAVERENAPVRSLEAFAVENAVEGCVRETWGALIALHQATHASERSLRAALARIARDEVRHAELAFRIQRWLSPRLSSEQRARVRAARLAAVAELGAEARSELPNAERARLGLPSGAQAAALLAALDAALGLTVG